jgi:hypothetical protein
MSLDLLGAALSEVETLLHGLGPRPTGDPHGIRELAKLCREEGSNVASSSRITRSIPSQVVFVAPAAKEMNDYADATANTLQTQAHALSGIAGDLSALAGRIEHAQEQHDHAKAKLASQVQDIKDAIAKHA